MLKQEDIKQHGDRIRSRIALGKGTLHTVKGAKIIKRSKSTVTVETTYPESISFNVWVYDDDGLKSYGFIHHNQVDIKPHNQKPINDTEPSKNPTESKYTYTPKEPLQELL